MNPTEQQLYCVKTVVEMTPGEVVKIEACAGAGKTSTLELISRSVLEDSIYLAFNKVTAVEAAMRFPAHVTCKTTHSLAYAAFGVNLLEKLSRPKGGYVNVAMTGAEIARKYGVPSVMNELGERIVTQSGMGLFVRQTVERYEQSADDVLSEKHVPKFDMEKAIIADKTCVKTVLAFAKQLWAARIDRNSEVMATHDTYLKLYQLSKPVLPFKVLYLDEAQDTTSCVLDIVMNQRHMKLVFVGDRRQAIYGWRGANNAMQMISGTTAALSMSFRYGPGIAELATVALNHDMTITGRADLPSEIGFNVVDRSKPYMHLFRTNSMLLMEAVDAIDRGQKVKVEIDVKDFVKLLQSAKALCAASVELSRAEQWRKDKNAVRAYEHKQRADALMKEVKHEKIMPYATWESLTQEAEESGGELKRIAGIVGGGQAEHVISVLENYRVPDDAIVTMTTAHKAKGREEEQVVLASDFVSHFNKEGEWVGLTEAEQNLLYVAITRAKWRLEINSTVFELMEKFKIQPMYGPFKRTKVEDMNAEEIEAGMKQVLAQLKREQRQMERSIIKGDGLPF